MVVKRRDTPKFGSIGDGLLFFLGNGGLSNFAPPKKSCVAKSAENISSNGRNGKKSTSVLVTPRKK